MDRDNPDSLREATAEAPEIGSLRDRAIGIIAFATVLSLLYVGRNVLIPLTVAMMLSLPIAPLVRRLRRIGLGQAPAVFSAVLTLALVVAGAAGVLGTQVLRMASSFFRRKARAAASSSGAGSSP